MLRPEEVQRCREYLLKGDLKSCLKDLFKLTDKISTLRSDIFVLTGRYERLERDYREGVIDFDTYERKRNGFYKEILELIDRLNSYSQKKTVATVPNKNKSWRTMSSIGFILFSSVSVFLALIRPNSDDLLIKTYAWNKIYYEGKYYGMMDIEFINKGEPIDETEFYFQIKEALRENYRLAGSFFPIRTQSDLIIQEDTQQDTEFTNDIEGRIFMPLKEEQFFNLYIYFSRYEDPPSKEELNILLQGLEIAKGDPLLQGSIDSIGKKKLSKLQVFSISPFYLLLPIISSALFVILLLNLLNWKK